MRAADPAMTSTLAQTKEDIGRAIARMHGAVLSSAIDCECRDRVGEALRDLERLERERIERSLLAAASDQRQRIEALLVLLGDFDPNETDALDDGTMAEASLLFADIAAAAELGSYLLRQSRQVRHSSGGMQEAANHATQRE
ncbi:hypothetical protein LAC81_21825 [Ensifer adhaerens]|uniref:hypothetical protein n=1 Tax=Ensifer adhaerens TaxID=106592 RepID=UPI003AF36173|nr:hypothetical protein LAC78_27965 [Ensifer adhaerens]UAY05162.1 hypothetical protein LAC80_32340 [Ensifer adhaerens]UAY12382.1 hypothetical protein LAC81_21825 [Ensifer adhaerens]